jgi:hypothetical protein
LRWGFSENEIVRLARRNLQFYRERRAEGRMFLMSVDFPELFSLDEFAAYLRVPITKEAREMVKKWPVVNDLTHQRNAIGQKESEVRHPPDMYMLFDRHVGLRKIEATYLELCRNDRLDRAS